MREYLLLDDHAISEFLKACTQSADPTLGLLGSGLLHRKLYKGIDATPVGSDQVTNFAEHARQLIAERGYDPDYAFEADAAADTPYLPYDPDQEEPETQIYIKTPQGVLTDVSELAEPLASLSKEYFLIRYYFPADLRDDMERIADETLRR